MSEEEKKIPEFQEEGPEAETVPEEPVTDAAEDAADKTGKKEKSKKKEKMFTLTREQMEQMELAARQLEASKEQYARLAAEYDNFRKRTAREKDSLYEDSKLETVKRFLPVYDNLERAVTAPGEDDSAHKKGLEMIFHQFEEVLTALGVTEIQAHGQPFDPERHNAVMHIDDETLGENTVADVLQKGFMLGEKVIRFATVRVAN